MDECRVTRKGRITINRSGSPGLDKSIIVFEVETLRDNARLSVGTGVEVQRADNGVDTFKHVLGRETHLHAPRGSVGSGQTRSAPHEQQRQNPYRFGSVPLCKMLAARYPGEDGMDTIKDFRAV